MYENTTSFNTNIKLYMFQTGILKTKLKYIKMNQSNEDFEIPRVWNPALLPSMEQMENFRKEGKIGN